MRIIILIWVVIIGVLALTGLPSKERGVRADEVNDPSATHRSTMEEIADLTFTWSSAKELKLQDVIFGVRNNELIFASYTSTNALTGRTRLIDNLEHVDRIVEDTNRFDPPIRITGGDITFEVDGLTFVEGADGTTAFVSSIHGRNGGRPLAWSRSGAAPALGDCTLTLVGACNETACQTGNCTVHLPTCDPCDCSAGLPEFCIDSAILDCAVSGCNSGLCEGPNEQCLCACLSPGLGTKGTVGLVLILGIVGTLLVKVLPSRSRGLIEGC